MKSKLRLFLSFILILAFPLAASAGIGVVPDENLGDVELGASETAIINLQNVGWTPVTIDSIVLETSGGDFTLVADPTGTTILGGEDLDVLVTFTPSALGVAVATLSVDWTNAEAGNTSVVITGTGVESTGDPVSVQEILDFFDQSVADGTLYGDGPGNSADGRLGAQRNKIKAAGDTLEDGGDACEQLLDAYQRTDGLPRPPDFVTGTAAGTLAQMILALMGELGCA